MILSESVSVPLGPCCNSQALPFGVARASRAVDIAAASPGMRPLVRHVPRSVAPTANPNCSAAAAAPRDRSHSVAKPPMPKLEVAVAAFESFFARAARLSATSFAAPGAGWGGRDAVAMR